MADDLIDPAVPEVTTDPVVDTESPFPGEFDADRARALIDKLRSENKELSTSAKEYQRLTSDPQAFIEFGTQQDWVALPEPEEQEPQFVDEETPRDPRVDELLQWRDEQNARDAKAAFDSDLDGLATAASLEINDRDRRVLMMDSIAKGFSPDATKAVFEDYVQEKEAERRRYIDDYTKSKEAPSAPPEGSPGEPRVDLSNMTERQQREARIKAIEAAIQPPPVT